MHRTRRTGITLIELLVVIFIILLITSITIPQIQPALENRRTREGARLLNVMFNAARNRAMESGRPAGIWLERMPGLPEACVSIHFAETPPPYSGDFLDSAVTTYYEPFGANYPDASIREYWYIVTPTTTTALLPDRWWNPEPNAQQLVRPGDYIKLNTSDRPLKLKAAKRSDLRLAGGDTYVWYAAYGANKRDNEPFGGFTNERDINGNFVIRWWDLNWRRIRWGPQRSWAGPAAVRRPGLPYQIIRQPQKMAAGAVTLPEGVVIDLNYSGTPFWSFHPRNNYSNLAADPNASSNSPYRGNPHFPNDETPIIVMFSPTGMVENVYSRINVNRARVIDWTEWRPITYLYFLVGDAEKVPCKTGWGAGQNGLDQYDNNWLDLTNYWVTINPFTGLVNTAEVSDFPDANDTIAHDPAQVAVSRRFANNPQAIGGR